MTRYRGYADRLLRGVLARGPRTNGHALRSTPSATDGPSGARPEATAAIEGRQARSRAPRVSAAWLLLPSLGLALAAQLLTPSWLTVGLYAGAGGLFLLTVSLAQRGAVLRLSWPRLSRRQCYCLLVAFGSLAAVTGSLLLLLPGVVEGIPERLTDAPRAPTYLHVGALWLVGLAAYLLAFLERSPRGWVQRLWAEHRRETLAVAGLVGLGLLLRVVRLDSFPRNFGGDEGSQALSALGVVQGTLTNMFATGWYGTPTLFYFIQALPLAVVPDPVVGARLAPALVGTVALLATYLLARSLFGVLVALVALAFLATYDYHVFFSRLATYHVTDTFFVAATLLFTYRALTRGRSLDYALAGLLLGLGFYGYFGARIMPAVLVVLLAREALVRRSWLRETWPRLLVLLAGAGLAVAPLVVHYLRFPNEYNHRINQVSVFASGWLESEARRTGESPLVILGGQLLRTALAFNYGPLVEIYYTPERGLLVWPAAIALVLGMAYALYRWRERAYWFVLVAFWIPVVGAALTEGMPQSQRIVILAPVVALLVALGLTTTARLLVRGFHLARPAALAALGLAVLVIAVLGLHYYFGRWAALGYYGGLNSVTATELAYYLRELGPRPVVYLLGGRLWCQSYLTIAYIAPGARCVNVQSEQVATLAPVADGGEVIVVAFKEREAELTSLAQRLALSGPHGPEGLFQAYSLPRNLAEAGAEALRATVLRGVRAYMGALSAANPTEELRRGGWDEEASRLIGQEFAATAAQARAQATVPFAELDALDITSIEPIGPGRARVRATVIGSTGLRNAAGQVIVRQRNAWDTEYFLSPRSGGWELDSVQRLRQTSLADGVSVP